MITSVPIPPAFFRFLEELKAHNHRDWFQANKERFRRDVQQPMLQLIAALQAPLRKISPSLQVDPSPVGGSLFRIYRDVRFSKDKSPYKTQMAARFPVVAGRKASPLGFYLAFGLDGNDLAGGVWQPEPAELKRIRDRIAAEPQEWKSAVGSGSFQREFANGEGAEMLQRVPKPYDPQHPCADDLRRKSFLLVASLSAAQVTRADLVEQVIRTYRAMTPLSRFLAAALNVKWSQSGSL